MATGKDGGALEGSAPLTQADIPVVVKAVVDQLKDQLPPQSREGGNDALTDPTEGPSSRAGKYNRALRLAAAISALYLVPINYLVRIINYGTNRLLRLVVWLTIKFRWAMCCGRLCLARTLLILYSIQFWE